MTLMPKCFSSTSGSSSQLTSRRSTPSAEVRVRFRLDKLARPSSVKRFIISIIRNLYSLRFRLTLPVKLGFLAVQAAITAFFNQMGLLGWLPFLAAGSFTLMMDTRDTKVLKLVIIFGQTLFAIYDISIKNYTSFAFDVATVISTIIGIIMLLRGKNKPEE